jgi:hypothetical protein
MAAAFSCPRNAQGKLEETKKTSEDTMQDSRPRPKIKSPKPLLVMNVLFEDLHRPMRPFAGALREA